MHKFQQKFRDFKERNRYRSLNLPGGVDLTSNDYLGMASYPALRKAAIEALDAGLEIGAAGSRLLRGHTQSHADLEDFAARHFGAGATLYFATGFQANYALFSTLPSRHDVIIYDSLIHASARDGIQSSAARGVKFAHNDLNALEETLKRYRDKAEDLWIAVESLYSMDGDIAPLADICALAERYGAWLIVDEAHTTGIYGDQGKGLISDFCNGVMPDNVIALHTCGKAVGVAGGLVCASMDVIDMLVNTARPFIYSTAPMPLQALLVRKSLEILASGEGDKRREKLFALCTEAKSLFGGHGTQIVPVILGDDARAVAVAARLQAAGYDIRAIRPPSVPENTARLRLSLGSALDAAVLQGVADMLQDVL